MAEYENGSLEASYVYGLDLVEQERDNTESYYLVDGLGSTKALTDENGNVTDSYVYDSYGNLIGSAGATENDYRFAGEQWDETLGQYYLRQRFYDPSSGRWDTYEGRIGEPITLNKYLYGNANPVSYTDPSGLYSFAEANAAASIGNILNEIQLDYGLSFVNRLLEGETDEKQLEDLNPLSYVLNRAIETLVTVHFVPLLGAIWSSGKLSSPKNAFKHWSKHKKEFPNLNNSLEYVNEAEKFVKSPPATALKKVRANGDVVIYDPVSNVFAVQSSSGVPRTMFKPDPSQHGYSSNLDYFNAQ